MEVIWVIGHKMIWTLAYADTTMPLTKLFGCLIKKNFAEYNRKAGMEYKKVKRMHEKILRWILGGEF